MIQISASSQLERARKLVDLLNLRSKNGSGTLSQQMYHLAERFLRNTHDAEDAVQDVFLALLDGRIDNCDFSSFPAQWARTITVNRCRDLLRRARTKRQYSQLIEKDSKEFDLAHFLSINNEDPSRSIALREDCEILRRDIASLPLKYRTPIVRFYLGGESYKSIAENEGITLGAVKNRMSQGLAFLREIVLVREGIYSQS